MQISDDIMPWLRNELYGYEMYYSHGMMRQIDSSLELPNNPEYRKMNGKILMLYRTKLTKINFPLFLPMPIYQIEQYIGRLGQELVINIPVDSLPLRIRRALNKLARDVKVMPIVITKNQLNSCTSQLRLKLHKCLDSISLIEPS